jgi:molybdopterin/thiamine biosynthesis adenylyltransferase/rhodanese-related sulfurtransferase
MIVPGVGMEGQVSLCNGRALVVGCGGIGSTVILYLAGAGVSLTLCDDDVVESSNLHRQIIHDMNSINESKAISAKRHANAINPLCNITVINKRITIENVRLIVKDHDVVIDATDNYTSRYILNDACYFEKIPLLSGSAVGMEGQLSIFDFRIRTCDASTPSSSSTEAETETETEATREKGGIRVQGPCYRCLYPDPSNVATCKTCADAGVLGPVPGLVGCLQAVEAMKLLMLSDSDSGSGSGNSDNNTKYASRSGMKNIGTKQMFYDARSGSFHSFQLPPRKRTCAVCGDKEHKKIHSMDDTLQSLLSISRPSPSFPTTTTGNCAIKQPVSVPEITPSDYESFVLSGTGSRNGNGEPQPRPHVLLDVRSESQYSMISLANKFNSNSDSVFALEPPQDKAPLLPPQVILHISLEDLQGGKLNKNKEKTRNEALLKINSAKQIVTLRCRGNATAAAAETSSASTSTSTSTEDKVDVNIPVPVYVLCRRGIDSVTATNYLLQQGMSNVFNISGGLNRWSTDVDKDFPIY